MATSFRHAWHSMTMPFLASAFAALSLLGCLSEKEPETAGVDDFPNSIYARVQGELAEADSGPEASIPSGALNVLQGTNTGPQLGGIPKQAALRRQAAFAASIQAGQNAATLHGLDSLLQSDPSWGVFAVSSRVGTKSISDSLFFVAGTNLFDSVSRVLGLAAAKRVERSEDGSIGIFMTRDGDGDGKVATPVDSARVRILISNSKGDTTESALLMVGGGPDRNFDTEADNLIYEAKWLRQRGDDTLSYAEYSDADGDGVLVDNGKPTLVDLTLYERNPLDKPEIAERRLKIRVLARYKQEPQEIRAFQGQEIARNGQVNRILLQNDAGGSDLLPGKKIQVRVTVTETPPTDSIVSAEIVSVIKPETVFGEDRDSLFSYSMKAEKRLGEEKLASFSFVAQSPIPPKQKPRYGTVLLDLEYVDSTTVHAEGVFNEAGFIADITGRDRKRYHGEWDAAGNLKRLSVTEP
jgi:hypothetical protein